MKLIENAGQVLSRSLSLWCIYVAAAAAAVHEYIASADHGAIPDAIVTQVDGIAVAAMFVAGLLAIPARIIKQASISPERPE